MPWRSRAKPTDSPCVGGGLRVPLAPSAALDLNGRYVFLEEQNSRLVPSQFDPDFWTTSVGLAIRF